ncbi:hypothetical protein Anapl_12780 [Anas platyrhynchos]|uniref:Uncharacterized protein n=1 Tax=Anas platyrhynchos TaxID=8839 RepID=R0M1H7_ANAPL|nr:hypothetical protein Anapl_12780 [Anas platyrhynchos]
MASELIWPPALNAPWCWKIPELITCAHKNSPPLRQAVGTFLPVPGYGSPAQYKLSCTRRAGLLTESRQGPYHGAAGNGGCRAHGFIGLHGAARCSVSVPAPGDSATARRHGHKAGPYGENLAPEYPAVRYPGLLRALDTHHAAQDRSCRDTVARPCSLLWCVVHEHLCLHMEVVGLQVPGVVLLLAAHTARLSTALILAPVLMCVRFLHFEVTTASTPSASQMKIGSTSARLAVNTNYPFSESDFFSPLEFRTSAELYPLIVKSPIICANFSEVYRDSKNRDGRKVLNNCQKVKQTHFPTHRMRALLRDEQKYDLSSSLAEGINYCPSSKYLQSSQMPKEILEAQAKANSISYHTVTLTQKETFRERIANPAAPSRSKFQETLSIPQAVVLAVATR